MKSNARRIATSFKVLFAILLMACTGAATAQTDAPVAEELAQVNRDGVLIRSGPADSYYPFGRMKRGDVIRIVGRKPDWVRVATAGPAFKNYFGFVKTDRSDRPVLDIDGETARTLGEVDILAANLNGEYAPRASWKRVHKLPADTEIRVLETIETERAIFYRVVLPAEAQGWISKGFVSPASAEQIIAWSVVMVRPTDEAVVAINEEATDVVVVSEDGAVIDIEAIDTDTGEVLARDEPTIDPVDADLSEMIVVTDEIDARTETETTVIEGMTSDGTAVAITDVTTEFTEVVTETEVIVGADTETALDPASGVRSVVIEEHELPGTMPAHKQEHQTQLEELEIAYTRLKREPIETAEVAPLRLLYLDLAVEAEPRSRVARFSEARAEQLSIWGELQERRIQINKLRKRLLMSAEEAEAVRLALAMHSRYVGVGRLTMSTVYTGNRLPNLIRLQDAGTGRTLAYIYVKNDPALLSMVGQIVGIVGEKTYDGDLRLNIIEPDRIDLLTPQGVGR